MDFKNTRLSNLEWYLDVEHPQEGGAVVDKEPQRKVLCELRIYTDIWLDMY